VSEPFAVVAARLARAAPREWDEFRKAFRQYEATAKDNMVLTQVDLLKFQGMALQCQVLAAAFDDALAAADRITARQAVR